MSPISPRPLAIAACAVALIGACSSALGVPATWATVGIDNPNGDVAALEMDGNDLWVGGGFSELPSGTPRNGVAKWNGTTWSGAGQGTNGSALALQMISGTLYAGGNFMSAGGTPNTFGLAQWNGTSWSNVGGVQTASPVGSLARSGSTLYIGGSFYNAGLSGYLPFNRLAKWNGSTWSALGAAWGPNAGDWNNPQSVNALAVDGSGNVYAGGDFTTAGGAPANYLVKWDGTSWSSLGTGVSGEVRALTLDAAGNLYAGGTFLTAGGTTVNRVAKWNGSSWSALGTGVDSTVFALETVDYCGQSVVYAGGNFGNAGGASARRVAAWDGTQWSGVGVGVGDWMGGVRALAAPGPSSLYAGGSFFSGLPAPSYLGQATVTNRACAPTGASAASTTPGEAVVMWSNPASGPAWTNLVATASPGGATCSPGSYTDTSCVVQGLTNGTSYTFTVKATNAAGDSPLSNTTDSVTPAAPPDAPTGATAVAGQDLATVSWTAPAYDGGAAITGYTVTATPGGGTCTTTGATSCTVTGLTPGTGYTFVVTATNRAGASVASTATASVTPPVPPAPPVSPVTPGTPTPPAPVSPALRGTTRAASNTGRVTTTGTLPDGATTISQTARTGGSLATRGMLAMARAKRARATCTIEARTYRCSVVLTRGIWTLSTVASGPAGVVATSTRRVVVRGISRSVPVTG